MLKFFGMPLAFNKDDVLLSWNELYVDQEKNQSWGEIDIVLVQLCEVIFLCMNLDGNHQRSLPGDTAWFRRQVGVTSGGVLYIYGQIGQHYQGDISIDDVELQNAQCTG